MYSRFPSPFHNSTLEQKRKQHNNRKVFGRVEKEVIVINNRQHGERKQPSQTKDTLAHLNDDQSNSSVYIIFFCAAFSYIFCALIKQPLKPVVI